MMAITRFCTLMAITLSATFAVAAGPGPEGRWRTVDDDTGEARSIVELTVSNGELRGRVERIFNPSEANPRCTECEGERKDQPIEGMLILWGLSPDDGEWVGGTVLDPESGKEYDARLKLIEGGARLELRGFMGVSWLGRTQVWERVDENTGEGPE